MISCFCFFLPPFMKTSLRTRAKHTLTMLEHKLAALFSKAPHLPAKWRHTLVRIAPWLVLIGGVLGLMRILSAGFLSLFFLSFAWLGGSIGQSIFGLILIIGFLISLFKILAFKPLQKRRKKGWDLVFAAILLEVISCFLDNVLGYGLVRNLIGPVIGLWLLFEVRSEYHV